jgi:hypothetical protein
MIFILAGNKFLKLFSLFRPRGRVIIDQTGSTRNRDDHSGGHREKSARAHYRVWKLGFDRRKFRSKYHDWKIDLTILLPKSQLAKQFIEVFEKNTIPY